MPEATRLQNQIHEVLSLHPDLLGVFLPTARADKVPAADTELTLIQPPHGSEDRVVLCEFILCLRV